MADLSTGSRRLRRFLARKKLSKAAFAEQIGTTAASVSRWVSGDRIPGRLFALAIYHATGIPSEAWDPDTGKRSAAA